MEGNHMDHFLKKTDLILCKILAKIRIAPLKKELSFLKIKNFINFRLLEITKMRKYKSNIKR